MTATTAIPVQPPAYLPRLLDLPALLQQKSHFLFGPRQSGKSSLIHATLPSAHLVDLLDSRVYLDLGRNPSRLGEEIPQSQRLVVIDEIQRLPELLHEVHRLMEQRQLRFLLTGSSARKLRRGGTNLLGGRARLVHLLPFTAAELGTHFSLPRALHHGLLPPIYFSQNPDADLAAYADAYLELEVASEGAARNLPAFSRFLRVAALCNGTIVNFTNLANDAQVPRTTIYEYFSILRETLILHELPAWLSSPRRKPIRSSKHYFFDIGVARFLQGRTFSPGTGEFGLAMECLVFHELLAHQQYTSGAPLAFWRSTSGFEVDFLIGDHTAIEVKAKNTLDRRDLKGLQAIAQEAPFRRRICITLERAPRTVAGIDCWPLPHFIQALWSGSLFTPD